MAASDHNTLEPATEGTAERCDRMLGLGVIVQPTGDHLDILKTSGAIRAPKSWRGPHCRPPAVPQRTWSANWAGSNRCHGPDPWAAA